MKERGSIRKGMFEPSFSQNVLIAIVFIFAIIICIFSLFSYFEGRENVIEHDAILREQTEKNLIGSVILMDKGLELFDATFDYQLEGLMQDVFSEYERSGRNPATIDLYRLKAELNEKAGIEGEIDIVLINETGIIEYSTFEPDIGLDFKQWPEAYKILTQLRASNRFSADRSVGGEKNILRKFVYLPSPDHRYLLQLSLQSDAFSEKRNEFSFQKLVEEFEKENENIESIRLFDSMGRYQYGAQYDAYSGIPADYIPDAAVSDTVMQVLRDKYDIEISDPENETFVHYFIIDLYSTKYVSGPQMNMVAQITYTTSILNQNLNDLIVSHMLIVILAMSIGFLFAFFATRFVSRPISEILDDVETIAQGNLNHTIKGGRGTEFVKLRNSINQMVANLKESMQRLGKSEAKIKCYSENLEKMVNARTAGLHKTNEEMNIYLNTITRNINLSTEAASSYLSLLTKNMSGIKKDIAENALAELKETSRIVRNVEIIRRMYEENLPLRQMNLNSVIGEVISETMQRYPEIHIHYSGTDARVIADELLRNVFFNLIENSRRFGGPDVEIWISVDDRNDEVEISLADNGPGIPDSIKQAVFDEYDLKKARVYGKGLGLFVVQSIIKWYGGRMWLDNRLRERPGEGLAIRFTLKRQ